MVASTVFAAVGIGIIAWRWPRLRGTTLVAPAIWAIIALCLLALADISYLHRETASGESGAAPYLLGVATLCPGMALLGAKRPQNHAWQLIVLSLAVVLCLPIAGALRPGGHSTTSLHASQSWFLALLIAITGTNYLPTRRFLASILVTLGQVLLLRDHLPFVQEWTIFSRNLHHTLTVAPALFMAAILVVFLGDLRDRNLPPPLDRLWVSFRDSFGAVWALRLQQRVNQSAEMYSWKLRLDWHGFRPLDGDSIPPQTEKAVRDNLNNLLRRFVSPQWIAERTAAAVD